MWTVVWRIACSCMNSFSIWHAHTQWNIWVQDTNTLDKYKKIVTAMFEDGIINEGRLLVLNTFTMDIGWEHPEMAADVEEYKSLIISWYQWSI